MASLTHIFLLSLCSFVVDSYFFDPDLLNDYQHQRIPLGLPNPFMLYPGMFEKSFNRPVHKSRREENKQPYNVADVTTPSTEDTVSMPSTTEGYAVKGGAEETFGPGPDPVDHYLMKNVKVNDFPLKKEGKENGPMPSALSFPEGDEATTETMLSAKVPDEVDSVENQDFKYEEEQVASYNPDNSEPELAKKSDFLLVPVTATNPALLNQNPVLNVNAISPMANVDGSPNMNQEVLPISPAIQPLNNNNNPKIVNQGLPYGNQPNQFVTTGNPALQPFVNNYQMNSIPNNLYAVVNIPNSGQGVNNMPNNVYYLSNNPNQMNNMGYQRQNSQPMYNLVRLDNVPSTVYNNPPYNLVPFNNQPNSYIPISNQQTSYYPMNNNNFIPLNNPNNFIPYNNQQNNFVPLNNQPIGFVSLRDQLNNNIPLVLQQQPPNAVSILALNEKEEQGDKTKSSDRE